jgi:hypothetical protein
MKTCLKLRKICQNAKLLTRHHGQSYGFISHLYHAVGLKAKPRYDFIKIMWLLYYFFLRKIAVHNV